MTATAYAAAPATPAQLSFIARLTAEGRMAQGSADTKREASAYIDALLKAPKSAPVAALPAVARPTEVGMYRKGDDIFRVKESATGNLYAMKLVAISGERLRDEDEAIVKWSFEYERGAIHSLTAADKLSLDEAKQFGIRTGTCCVCALPLKDAKSVLAGIGPVCAKKF